MKKHIKIYLDYFNHEQWLPCEVCGKTGVDFHHIECRGMGGTKMADTIENIMLLCRECHIEFGDKKQHMDYLKEIHNGKIKRR